MAWQNYPAKPGIYAWRINEHEEQSASLATVYEEAGILKASIVGWSEDYSMADLSPRQWKHLPGVTL